ncbi:winged helix DNA-binding domain-containing protein [Lentzea sp. HUAS12]|uniref:winged helix DNA-binding domain-containing protein n=1 Tax=Lentzea sp. HUAS12 TaxID=2951806 RepID=UPI0020A10D0C|nr:winged helix DNA-binding domain-containing protein [Lentzea sp. HUAS12]USX48329.1 winged helix DNA-binding domain-containing protein [Lentzea sp. HUAS12]
MKLSARQLNRALLARQFLLERSEKAPLEVVEHLVGMQSQVPLSPYVGLWSRVSGFQPAALAATLEDRSAVRLVLMRGTIHLVSARDALVLRPLLKPVLDRVNFTGHNGKQIAGIDPGELADLGRSLLEEEPRTREDLGKLLQERWPGHQATALAYAVQLLVPLAQIPPRGVWGVAQGRGDHATLHTWLGAESLPAPSITEVVSRYLGAFGPASVQDAQTWSGLTRLSEVFDRLPLRRFTDENGKTLFDHEDSPRPDEDTPAPPRFLPEFDNVALSHADRTRITSPGFNGSSTRGGFTVDGFVSGTWKVAKGTLSLSPYQRLLKRDSALVEAEGLRLLEFVAPGADHAVIFE